MSEADDLPRADQAEGAPHPRETVRLYGHAQAEAIFYAFRRAVAPRMADHGAAVLAKPPWRGALRVSCWQLPR